MNGNIYKKIVIYTLAIVLIFSAGFSIGYFRKRDYVNPEIYNRIVDSYRQLELEIEGIRKRNSELEGIHDAERNIIQQLGNELTESLDRYNELEKLLIREGETIDSIEGITGNLIADNSRARELAEAIRRILSGNP